MCPLMSSKRGLAIGRHPGKAQGSLEMVVALITVLTILLCSLNLFIWLNLRFVWRQQAYEAERKNAGSYVGSADADAIKNLKGVLSELEKALREPGELSSDRRRGFANEIDKINKEITDADLNQKLSDLKTKLSVRGFGGFSDGDILGVGFGNRSGSILDINKQIAGISQTPPPGAVDESGYPKLDIFNLKEYRTWWERK